MVKSLMRLGTLSILILYSEVGAVSTKNAETDIEENIATVSEDEANEKSINNSDNNANSTESDEANGEAYDKGNNSSYDKTANETGSKKKNANEGETVDTPTVEPASYDKLVPVIGWARDSGDSARTVKQWVRWMKYLRMKKPEVMKWIDGLVLRIYPKNEVFRALYVRGIYDPNVSVVIDELLPKNGVFIDAGAGMGYCSLLASRKVGSEGHVMAVEPSSRDFIRLVDNVNINKLHEVISCYKVAFSDQNGKADIMVANDERSGLNTLGTDFSTKGVEKVGMENVEKITIDDFLEREHIKSIDVLKLDIEGSEFAALSGAKNTIQKHRPAIVLGIKKGALEACGASFGQLEQWLKDMKYIAYRLKQNSESFSLERIYDLSTAGTNIVFCLHDSVVPPQLPQPKCESLVNRIWSSVVDFFTK